MASTHPQDTYDLNVLPRDTQTGIDQLTYPGVSGGRRVRESLSGGQEFVDLDVMIGCDLEDQSSSTSMCSGDSPTASSRTACTEHHA